MLLDELILKLDEVEIRKFEEGFNIHPSITHALSSAAIGSFRWDMTSNKVFFTDMIYQMCNLKDDFEGTFLSLIQLLFDNTMQFIFVQSIKQVIESEKAKQFEFMIYSQNHQGLRWMKITSEMYTENDQKFLIGMMQDIHELKTAKDDANNRNKQLFQILDGMPIPIYYYDTFEKVIFTNEAPNRQWGHLNLLVEKHINGEYNIIEKSELISDHEILLYTQNHMKYRLSFMYHQEKYTMIVHRVLILNDDDIIGKLYIHEDITEDFENENKMMKILKVNELTIEIKDIVDQIDDLQKLYDFLLSKIHIVIPAVKRACVLRLDADKQLYMAANYGYDKGYQEQLNLPFKDSFARMSLRDDFSKSIIINNVQKKFATLYPDINTKQDGFVMESNMTAPMVIGGELYGLLSVDSDIDNIFDEVDLNLIDYIRIQLERSIIKYRNISRVKRNAIIDSLTGIYNRRHLLDLFDEYVLRANHLGKTFFVVIFDLDGLKKINDTFGHLAGDMIIKQFAFMSNKEVRDVDIMARYGGDEFVGIFWDIDRDILHKKLDYWKDILEVHPLSNEGNDIVTKFSYGISEYALDAKAFDNLLDIADKNMYKHKNSKK